MIISYKHKFIFWKSYKTAGSSLLQAFGKHCGETDVVAQPQSLEGASGYSRNMDGFYNHAFPDEIRERIPKKIWNDFFKFTIVRNPWDVMVSGYWWTLRPNTALNKRLGGCVEPNLDDKEFLKKFEERVRNRRINHRYYFNSNNKPVADFYIRFENLNNDYKLVCNKLGIPVEALLHMKSEWRKSDKSYWDYYNDDLREIVANRCSKTIEHFNYKFGI
jgi:hypothetical protein